MEKELPESWVETTIADLIEKVRSVNPSDVFDSSFLYVDISSIDSQRSIIENPKEIDIDEAPSRARQLIEDGDTLVSTVRPNLRRIAIVNSEFHGQIASTGFSVLRPKKILSSRFLFYNCLQSSFTESLIQEQRGASYPAVRNGDVVKQKIFLPPLAEQQRIVAKLDSLFGHLDVLKGKLDGIPDLLKNFRQQVLTQAVTGKLTEDWREGKDLGEWDETTIGAFMTEVKDKVIPTDQLEFKYVGLEHIESSKGLREFSSSIGLKSQKTKFRKGDVLYGKLRPYLDKHFVADFDGICSTDILVYRNESSSYSSFFNYFIGCTAFIRKANFETKGINLPRISSKSMNEFAIGVPTLYESEEIVKRVEALFAVADKIEAQYERLKSKIDTLPQAILNKAFKGELVAQNPNDEPAWKLLERVRQEKKKK